MNTLRFRFKDLGEINYPEWEWKKIEDCCLLIKDGTHGTHKDVIAGIPLLSAKDIYENSVHIPFDARKISEHDYKKIYAKYELEKEDVLITIVGTLGRTAIIDSNTPRIAFQRSVAVMRPSTQLITAKYLNYVCNSHNFQNEIEIRKKKGAQPGIYLGELSSIPIPVPSLPEQQKIADFLSSYDEKIRLQRERVESLERRKKGLLQKVFRQEIRFKDDDGKEFTEWMTRTYSDVMDGFEYGLPYPSVKFDGINKYLRITDIDDITRRYQIEGCVSPGGIIRDNYKLVEGDILFARTGATVGKTYIYSKNDGNVYYAGYLIKGHVKKDYVPYFVFCTTFTNEYWNYIKETSMRTGQPGVNSKEFASYKFKCPNYEEQKKIAKLFTAIDDQINIERERLSTMETIKKGLLQGLFC